ncbi:hypothetical protein FQN49_001231 [Arthroderma sp. PD_2]|nr:hypothetical protein FQN49_001231 [Arthroderma sp. PD_2]
MEEQDTNSLEARVQDSPVKPWAPDPPDMRSSAVIAAMDPKPLHFSLNSQVYRFKEEPKVYKAGATQREFDFLKDAGDCAVEVLGRSLWKDMEGKIQVTGIIMSLETPFDPKTIQRSQRKGFMEQIISIVHELHSKGIIHGDVKPANFLLCADGRLRMCDFSESLRVDEDPSEWEGVTTTNYVSPYRTKNWPDLTDPPPTIEDDLYGVGVTIWELYTGKVPFEDWYIDDIMWRLHRGETVDVNEVEDEDARNTICQYLRYGGAKI